MLINVYCTAVYCIEPERFEESNWLQNLARTELGQTSFIKTFCLTFLLKV